MNVDWFFRFGLTGGYRYKTEWPHPEVGFGVLSPKIEDVHACRQVFVHSGTKKTCRKTRSIVSNLSRKCTQSYTF